MKTTIVLPKRVQSFGEELANSISHGLGALAAIVAAPILIVEAVQRDSARGVVGASVFAATTVLLYLASSIYHALPRNRVKEVFQLLDHGAIFLLIAGTYTPFTLGVLHGAWGWTLLGLIWSLALMGILLKVFTGLRYSKLSTGLYLVMGWLALIAIKPFLLLVSPWGLFWLLAGGLSYTAGVLFFVLDNKIPYGHFIWHLFVLAGTSCHFIAVFWYAN